MRTFTDAPEEIQEPIQHFAQIGPPRNVTVQQSDAGDEFVVSWYPPDYGLDTLRVYVVRWFREPGHFLMGSAETRNNYYNGKPNRNDRTLRISIFNFKPFFQ